MATKRNTSKAVTVPVKGEDRSTFTQAIADEIARRIASGEPLAQICRDPHMPGLRTVYDWMEARAEFAASIARAREAGFDVIATETLEIVDQIPERTNTEHGSKVDTGHVAWLKNRAEQRLKLLAKWDPKRYGDKLAIGGAEDLPAVKSEATVTLDPSEAYKRLLGGAL